MLIPNTSVQGYVSYETTANEYFFDLESAQSVQLWLTKQVSPSANFELYDADTGRMLEFCMNFGNLSGLMEAQLEAGHYKVKVFAPEEGQATSYELLLRVSDPIHGVDISNSEEDAFPIFEGGARGFVDAYYNTKFEYINDIDVYKMEFDAPTNLFISVLGHFINFGIYRKGDDEPIDIREGFDVGTYYVKIKGYSGDYKLYVHPNY